MTEFERILADCLDDLRAGRRDVDACLGAHLAHAEELRPYLLAASATMQAYNVHPSAEFAAEARERFLFATGQRITEALSSAQPSQEFAQRSRERFLIATGEKVTEAYDLEPSPSFFAAARFKMMGAARRIATSEAPRRALPLFGTPFKAFATGAAAAVMMLGFSTYTVASASDSLPGDWQYGVKLQTERVRLALAFSEDAERSVKLDIAAERAREIERLAAKGKIIGPGVLDRLADQTAPLVEAAKQGELDQGDIAKLNEVTGKQKSVLEQAQLQASADASDKLEQARAIAHDGFVITSIDIAATTDTAIVITPVVPLDETAEPTAEPTQTPTAEATSDATTTPGATPTGTAGQPTPVRTSLSIDPTPVDDIHGVSWIRLAVGRLNTLIPSEEDGWRIAGINVADGPVAAPTLVRITNADGTSIIVLNPSNGDVYWFIAVNGVFDEVQLRNTRDGQTYVIDREVISRLYGSLADIPLYVLDHIELAPRVTPTPEPSETPSVTP